MTRMPAHNNQVASRLTRSGFNRKRLLDMTAALGVSSQPSPGQLAPPSCSKDFL